MLFTYEHIDGRLARKQLRRMMKNKRDLLDCNEPVERCEECPAPDGCVWECVMHRFIHEDVAKIRGEKDDDAVH